MTEDFGTPLLGTVGLAICAGVLGWYIIVWANNLWSLRSFTGPLSIPMIGNLYDIRATAVMKYLSSCSQKYGKTFLFWPGSKPMLVCQEISDVRQVLTDTKTFIKGDDYTQKFSIVFGDGLVTSNGDTHKHDRACLAKYFLRGSIEAHLTDICNSVKNAMNEMLEEAVGTNKGINVRLARLHRSYDHD